MSKEGPKETRWLASVARAGRRVFPYAGTHAPTPPQRASALLSFVQRADLGTLEGQALEDATADVATISLGGSSPIRLDEHPKVDGPALAEFAGQLSGMIEQLTLPGESGPRESGLAKPAQLRHVMRWDRATGGPAQSFFSGPFLMSALWQGRMLLGQHIDKIARCERCEKFFMVRKGAKFCSLRCAQNARAARFISNLEPKKRKRVRQRDYFQRLLRKDPAAAERYMSHLRATDPAAVRWLKSWASRKNEPARRRLRSGPNNK
jgi:hypothetical protein